MIHAKADAPEVRRHLALLGLLCVLTSLVVAVERAAAADFLVPEKDELTLGFIKLTDCAPLVIAKEMGFFEEEGLFVTLEAQANWKILLDRVIDGRARRRPHARRGSRSAPRSESGPRPT